MNLAIKQWLILFGFMCARYLLVAGGTYLVLYRWKKERFSPRKLQPKTPSTGQIKKEIKNSIISLFIFSLTGIVIYIMNRLGYLKLYKSIGTYGLAWFVMSIVAGIIVHDTYFYWTHRLLHVPLLYKKIHRVHHLSSNTTPFTSFSFHPVEAIINAAYIPLVLCIMPVHRVSVFIIMMYMLFMNVGGHCGYELVPSILRNKIPGKWCNTSTLHNHHHKTGKNNYSLYFNIWDRLMGTYEKSNNSTFL